MGCEVKVSTNAGFHVQVAAARRRAVVRGGEVIRTLAIAGAPRDTGAMDESARVELDVSEHGDAAAIVFGEFYSQWEETKEEYKHPFGHAHFLELALIGGHEAALEVVASEIRASLGQ